MATIPTIQLLRNNNIYSSRADARSALELYKKDVPDGGVILARYSGTTGEEQIIKTLAGFVSNISTPQNATVTIIDVEGASENVQDAITSAINRLNQVDAEVEGEYVSSVLEENGIITVTRKPLPSFGEKTDSGKAITAITQTNGEVSVKFGGVAAANVSVADEGNIFTATTVEGVLSEIQNYIGTGGTVTTQISDAINALNSEKSGTSNHITVGVEQVAGKITSVTVSDSDIASAALLGTKEDASTAQTAFGYIAKEVDDRTAAINALSTSSTVTLEDAAGTESGVLKVYTIKQGGTSVGTINIPKDLVVTSGSVVKGNWNDGTFTEEESGSGTALKLVIANQTNPVYINTLDLVKDHTAGNGIAISDTNEISVQIAEGSENFLTVDEKGVKLSGVQAAIDTTTNNKISTLKASIKGESDHVDVTVGQADGIITSVTVANEDIASATLLGAKGDAPTAETAFGYIAKEVTARTAAIEALNLGQVGGIGQVIATISQTDGQVSASAIDLTANNVKATASTGVPTAVDVAGETVSEQIASLATSIKSASTAAAAAHTVVNAKPDGHVKVTVSSENSHDVVTITEDDIASAAALTAETSSRVAQDDKIEAAVGLNADGSHITTTGNYTSDATTVVGEIAALDTKLKEVSDTLGTGVTTVATVTAQLQALSGTTGDASGVTSVEGAKKYTDGKIEELSLTPVGGNGQVITTISQTDGKVSVTAATLGAENVTASTIDDDGTTVAVTGTNVSAQIASLAKSIKTVDVDVSEQLENYYTKTEVDNELSNYYTKTEVDNNYYTMYATDYKIATEIQALHAEVESTIESTLETTTTEAIKIVQDMGIIESITLGAFDCGTY